MFECNVDLSKPAKEKNIVVSFSLLMRLFEWCHEDAKDDVDMHKMMEKLIAFNDGVNPLTIDCYDCLIADTSASSDDTASNDDLQNAYELGSHQAENGIDLSMDDYSDPSIAITAMKNNGYGASNAEIEQFWQGYEDKEPMKSGCFNKMDMSEIMKSLQNDERQNSEAITMSEEEPCCNNEEECLDDDINAQIQHIINTSKF